MLSLNGTCLNIYVFHKVQYVNCRKFELHEQLMEILL